MGEASLFRKAQWTVAIFGTTYALKLLSNVVLAHLLAPEIFGVMLIVNTVRVGIELFSDLGLEQNLVHSKRGLEEKFFDTLWTIQLIRGALLSVLFLAITPFIADAYHVDRDVFLLISIAPLLNGFCSPAVYTLAKNLRVKERNLFELAAEVINVVACVTLAVIAPSVWALVWGALIAIAGRSALSYILPHPRHRLRLEAESVREIFAFGKWIMGTSLVMYVSLNLDRFYFGSVAPFAVVGVFGIAKTIADLPTALSRRLSFQIVFPFLSRGGDNAGDRTAMLAELGAARLRFVLLAAIGLGGFAGWSDVAVSIIYDARYIAAGWMLFVLMGGAWFSILSNLNEGLLLATGRPAYTTYANIARLAVLAISLPLGFSLLGYTGILLAIMASEFSQYMLIGVGQSRIGITFRKQDLLATVVFLALIGASLAIRQPLGLGMPWAGWALLPN